AADHGVSGTKHRQSGGGHCRVAADDRGGGRRAGHHPRLRPARHGAGMIVLDGVALRQGAFALAYVSLEIPAGRYGVLMGRTGCGKTSLLEAVAGLRPVAAGRIELNGTDVTAASPARRGVGYVPQDGALFKTQTVFDQLAFALVIRRWDRRKIEERVSELA